MIKKTILACALALSVSAHAQKVPLADWKCWQISSASIAPGSGYAPGKYQGIALAGDDAHGSEAVADITVGPAGSVVDVKFVDPGNFYIVGNVLTAKFGGGTGFAVKVQSVMDFHPALLIEHGNSKSDLMQIFGENPCPPYFEAR